MREAMGVLLKSGCPLPLTFTACEWLSAYCASHSCAVLMAETILSIDCGGGRTLGIVEEGDR